MAAHARLVAEAHARQLEEDQLYKATREAAWERAAAAKAELAVQEAEQRHAAAEARVKAAHATQIRTLLRQLDGVESQLEQRIERIETVHRAFSAAGRSLRGSPSFPSLGGGLGGGFY